MFTRFIWNQTYRIFLFLHISLAIYRNFKNWHQIFYNTFGWSKIYALSIFDFLVSRFHGNIDYLKKQPNYFPNNWCNFHIDQFKGRLVKRQLKMLSMVQKKLYRVTLNCNLMLASCWMNVRHATRTEGIHDFREVGWPVRDTDRIPVGNFENWDPRKWDSRHSHRPSQRVITSHFLLI